jgi:hypothetical protein
VVGGWRLGIAVVIGVVTAFFVGTALLDLRYLYLRQPSVSVRIQRWSSRYRFWSLALLLVYGALFAHLFVNNR